QGSMVRRWLTRREEGWWWRWWLNAAGATITGLVMLVIAGTKFTHGAWIVVLLIPLLVALFVGVHRHYADVAGQVAMDRYDTPPPPPGPAPPPWTPTPRPRPFATPCSSWWGTPTRVSRWRCATRSPCHRR